MNVEAYLNELKKENKYHAVKTEVDGIKFDSRAEATRYCELKLMQKAKKIKSLKLQPKYILQEAFACNGKKIRAITYTADFSYFECSTEKSVVEDVKGLETEVFKIKKKLFLHQFPWLDLRIIK